MKLLVEIYCDNDAFKTDDGEEWPDRRGYEIRQILAKANFEQNSHGILRDSNGNMVGNWQFVTTEM